MVCPEPSPLKHPHDIVHLHHETQRMLHARWQPVAYTLGRGFFGIMAHPPSACRTTMVTLPCAGRKRGRGGDAESAGRRKVGGISLADESERIDDMPVDPNEPTYCLCQQVSYGEMIACDNPGVSLAGGDFFCFFLFVSVAAWLVLTRSI